MKIRITVELGELARKGVAARIGGGPACYADVKVALENLISRWVENMAAEAQWYEEARK